MTILFFLVAFSLSVAIHEAAHFRAAHYFGIGIERASLGFGKVLWSRRRNGTEYVLSLFPLGGYVILKHLKPNDAAKAQRGWFLRWLMERLNQDQLCYTPGVAGLGIEQARPWQRILVFLAGPLSNLVLVLVALLFVKLLGFWSPQGLDVVELRPGSVAQRQGVMPGMQFNRVNGKEIHNLAQLESLCRINREPVKLSFVQRVPTRFSLKINGESHEIRMGNIDRSAILVLSSGCRHGGIESLNRVGIALSVPVKVLASAPGMPLQANDYIKGWDGQTATGLASLRSWFRTRSGLVHLDIQRDGQGKTIALSVQDFSGLALSDVKDGAYPQNYPLSVWLHKLHDSIASVFQYCAQILVFEWEGVRYAWQSLFYSGPHTLSAQYELPRTLGIKGTLDPGLAEENIAAYAGTLLAMFAQINMLLFAFNMVPGLFLDGGQILRESVNAILPQTWGVRVFISALRIGLSLSIGLGLFLLEFPVLLPVLLIAGIVWGSERLWRRYGPWRRFAH